VILFILVALYPAVYYFLLYSFFITPSSHISQSSSYFASFAPLFSQESSPNPTVSWAETPESEEVEEEEVSADESADESADVSVEALVSSSCFLTFAFTVPFTLPLTFTFTFPFFAFSLSDNS